MYKKSLLKNILARAREGNKDNWRYYIFYEFLLQIAYLVWMTLLYLPKKRNARQNLMEGKVCELKTEIAFFWDDTRK